MSVLVAQNQESEPIGAFGPPLRLRGIDLVVWSPWRGESPPSSLSGVTGMIALGGAANPDEDDRFAWLEQERVLLGEAVERGLPVIGVCLGAQLLAQALGASVRRLAEPRIGWVRVDASEAAGGDSLYRTLPRRLFAFAWHRYGFALPPGAQLLACGDSSPQAFRFGEAAWGLQFHLDADEDMIGDWIRSYVDELLAVGIDPKRLARETSRRAAASRRHAFSFGDAFASLAECAAPVREGCA